MLKPEKIIGKLSAIAVDLAMSKYNFRVNYDSFLSKVNSNATYTRKDDEAIRYYVAMLDWYMESSGCRTEVLLYLFYVLTVQVWLINKYSDLDELIASGEVRIFDSELDAAVLTEKELEILKQTEDINNEIALFMDCYVAYEDVFKCIENKDRAKELLNRIDLLQEQLLKKISVFENTSDFDYYIVTSRIKAVYEAYCIEKKKIEEDCYAFIKEYRETINSPEECLELAKEYAYTEDDEAWVIFKNGTAVLCEDGDMDEIKKEALCYLEMCGRNRNLQFNCTDEDNDNGDWLYFASATGEEMGVLDGIYNYFWVMDNDFNFIDFNICRERFFADCEQMEISCVINKDGVFDA